MKRLGLGVVEEGRREGSAIASASIEIASVLANVRRSRVRGIPTKRGRMSMDHIFWKCVLEVDELVARPHFCIVCLISERLIIEFLVAAPYLERS
jgi:hypothetical protein